MGKGREKAIGSRSQTLPSSPSHSFSSSSSSSDFEFTVSVSPRATFSSTLCPADELFYKGQLLPLHLSPRLSMVRTLLLASSSSSSSSSATASRDSTGSSNSNDSQSSFASDLALLPDCDSSRPSSVTTEDDEFKRLNNGNQILSSHHHQGQLNHRQIKKNKYFSLSRFSSVFKKENNKNHDQENMAAAAAASSSVKKISSTAKDVIRKYLKKVKPLYDKLSQTQKQHQTTGGIGAFPSTTSIPASFSIKAERSVAVKEIEQINARKESSRSSSNGGFPHSFSGNLRHARRRSCISSCPSSMRSSPTHSRNGFSATTMNTGRIGGSGSYKHSSDTSSMEELQSAIQGAIAHCKNSLLQNKTTAVSNEI